MRYDSIGYLYVSAFLAITQLLVIYRSSNIVSLPFDNFGARLSRSRFGEDHVVDSQVSKQSKEQRDDNQDQDDAGSQQKGFVEKRRYISVHDDFREEISLSERM